jgi:hypothetical protein
VARVTRRRGRLLVLFKRDVRSAVDHHLTVGAADRTVFSAQVIAADRPVTHRAGWAKPTSQY